MTHTERDWWQEQDGKVVTLEGYCHILHVSVYEAIYPYRHTICRVSADPLDKASVWYQTIKAQLGDDWSTDVLSSPDLAAAVMTQLGWQEAGVWSGG